MSTGNARVAGSNFSTFQWRGQNIAYLEGIADAGQQPVNQPQAIHPLGSDYPIEWAIPRAMGGGSFAMTIRELWSKPVWQHLQGLSTANDILDVWRLLAEDPTAITCQTIIKPPGSGYWRIKTYHNVLVSVLDDTETFVIDSMTVPRTVGCVYTHATRSVVSGMPT